MRTVVPPAATGSTSSDATPSVATQATDDEAQPLFDEDDLDGAPALQALKVLPFHLQAQRQTRRCWSAVSASVARYYGSPTWTQHALARRELGHGACCRDGPTPACNVPWFLDRGLRQVGNLGAVTAGSLRFVDVRREIDAGRPLGVRVRWAGGGPTSS